MTNTHESGLTPELKSAVAETEHRIAVALGERPPDLVLKGGQIVDVYRGRLWQADIAIAGRRIAAVRPDIDAQGSEVIDCRGLTAGPGFIEPHMHIETTFVTPRQLARAITPFGTTTLFADGTDASYVGGAASVKALFDSARDLPLRIFLSAPSYSAYLPDLQTVGGVIDLAASLAMLDWPQTVSLGEVVAARVAERDPEYLAKVVAYLQAGKRVSGHTGDDRAEVIDAFTTAGATDDHTSWSGESIEARLARGMTLFLVEAPGRRRLSDMLTYVVQRGLPTRSLCLCIDNISILEIARDGYGYLDYPVSLAVKAGVPLVEAIQMASLNPATYFGRAGDLGSLTPGRLADIQLWDDLKRFRPRMVLFEGRCVATDGKMIVDVPPSRFPDWYLQTVRLRADLLPQDLLPVAPSTNGEVTARIIELDGPQAQAANHEQITQLQTREGRVPPAPERDIVSLCVVERYGLRGQIGYGYLAGSGLQRGALATSVSISDSNIVVMGCDSLSMWNAVQAVAGMQGGFVVADGESILASLPAPVGGQMSDEPFEDFVRDFHELNRAAAGLGCRLTNPFLTMASTVLMTVPDLGLSDGGYIDARTGKPVATFIS